MQENKLIKTINDLYALGQVNAIVALANSIKEAHDYALELLKEGAVKELETALKKDPIETKVENIVKTPSYKYYQESWSIAQKVQYILKMENRFLHFREMAKIIIALEGKGDEDELTSALSNGTRSLKQDETIVKYKHGKSHKYTFWGSPKWMDKNGNIKDEFMFDSTVLESDKDSYEQVDLFKI